MNERINAHIEGLFQEAPKTKKIIELKEEIISNCNCKYDDLIADGSSPDEAFKSVIAGIGDVSELIAQLETGMSADAHLVEEGKKRSADGFCFRGIIYPLPDVVHLHCMDRDSRRVRVDSDDDLYRLRGRTSDIQFDDESPIQ